MKYLNPKLQDFKNLMEWAMTAAKVKKIITN
jgi:hypothetical protein